MSAATAPAALVAIGANLGDPEAAVRWAFTRLRAFAAGPLRASSLYRSVPVDCPPGSPDFVNAAAWFVVREDLGPEALLRHLLALEAEYGRVAGRPRNSPRELDLDLVLFGTARRDSAALTLPHPRAHLRRFVLEPAAEVAAAMPWPGRDRTVAELLALLPAATPDDAGVRRL